MLAERLKKGQSSEKYNILEGGFINKPHTWLKKSPLNVNCKYMVFQTKKCNILVNMAILQLLNNFYRIFL